MRKVTSGLTGDIFFNLKQPVPLIMKGQNLRDVRWHISISGTLIFLLVHMILTTYFQLTIYSIPLPSQECDHLVHNLCSVEQTLLLYPWLQQ